MLRIVALHARVNTDGSAPIEEMNRTTLTKAEHEVAHTLSAESPCAGNAIVI